MATEIKIKRSSVSGNIPTTSQISTGELALNMADRDIYYSDGSNVKKIKGHFIGSSAPSSPSPVEGDLWYDTSVDALKTYDGSNWTTINASSGLTEEEVQDTIATMLQAGNGVRLNYDDANNELEITSEALEHTVKNVSSGQVSIGTVVYQSGSTGTVPEIGSASNTSSSTMPAIGIVAENISSGQEGKIVFSGLITGINTSSFNAGDTLYVGTSGQLTDTAPTGESALIQNIGKVIKVHATNGSILVTGAGRTNATPNLNNGKFFLGNSSNQAVTATFGTEVSSVITTDVTKSFVDALNVNADTLDSFQGSYYLDWTNTTNKPDPTITLTGDVTGSVTLTDLQSGTITTTIADDSHNHIISNVDGLQAALDAKVDDSEKGAANGVATLDSSGLVPSSQLPSYVDDVLEYATAGNFPSTGETGKIYVATQTGDVYRWGGSNYIQINDAVSSADQATQLATARTIALSGDVSGSVSFDGTQDVTITATIADDSHSHIIANVDGLQTALDSKANLSGATFTGNVTVQGNLKTDVSGANNLLQVNAASSYNSRLVFSENNVIGWNLGQESSSGDFNFYHDGEAKTRFRIQEDGDIIFYGSDGTTQNLFWDAALATLKLKDNTKITFGDSADLSIYHDGSDSYIDDSGTGNLNIRANNFYLQKYTGENMLYGLADGKVAILHDNTVKLETQANGITVFGEIKHGTNTESTLNFDDDTDPFGTGATNFTTLNSASGINLLFDNNDNDTNGFLVASGSSTSSSATKHFFVDNSGSSNFYDDTGATVELKWDSVNSRLNFKDGIYATFGDANDLQIYHDGSQSVIKDNGTGQLLLAGENTIAFTNANQTQTYASMVSNGAVSLSHNGSTKIATTSTGANITGTLGVSSVDLGDWVVTQSGTSLYFSINGVNKMKLDSNGNLDVVGNVNSNATIT